MILVITLVSLNEIDCGDAEVAELADALRSGRSELIACVSSSLTFGTKSLI